MPSRHTLDDFQVSIVVTGECSFIDKRPELMKGESVTAADGNEGWDPWAAQSSDYCANYGFDEIQEAVIMPGFEASIGAQLGEAARSATVRLKEGLCKQYRYVH